MTRFFHLRFHSPVSGSLYLKRRNIRSGSFRYLRTLRDIVAAEVPSPTATVIATSISSRSCLHDFHTRCDRFRPFSLRAMKAAIAASFRCVQAENSGVSSAFLPKQDWTSLSHSAFACAHSSLTPDCIAIVATLWSCRRRRSTSCCFLIPTVSNENISPSSSVGSDLFSARISFTVAANNVRTRSAYASVRLIRASVFCFGSLSLFFAIG